VDLNEELIMKNEEVMNNKNSSFFILHSSFIWGDTYGADTKYHHKLFFSAGYPIWNWVDNKSWSASETHGRQ